MKPKKGFLILLFVLLLLIAGGISYLKFKSGKESAVLFDSIKDALSKNLTLSCEFNNSEGMKVSSFIKNGAVRVTTLSANGNQSGEMILAGEKMYIWDTKTKQGFVYDTPENSGETTENSNIGDFSGKDYLAMIEEYKNSCVVATVADSYFEVPKDVSFKDMNKFLEDLKNQKPQGYQVPQE